MNNKRVCRAAFRALSLAALILLCAPGFAQNKGSGQYDGEYMTVTHNPEGRILWLIRITGTTWAQYICNVSEGEKDWRPWASGTFTVRGNVITMIDPKIDPAEDMISNTFVYVWKRIPPDSRAHSVIILTDELGVIYLKQ
jgi:hypothetical protein